ncbi:MAG: discoidin domain-containing protein, partial [Gemmatimonadetes bacterium]|nr:discoidin domain-containing protein [Gemmatimonadota bacterium]
MRPPCSLPLGRFAAVCMLLGLGARLGLAEVETYHLGRGGLSWSSQADIQNGTVGVEGALQPLELRSGQNLMELLRAAGQTWLNGSPSDFTKPGQPRTWSNDGPFNQVNGPLQLVDGDPSSSSEGAFRTARNQAGATFFWDLGAPFPIERVRFAPAPGELDWFIKAFELRVSDGEQFNEVRRPIYRLLSRVENNKDPVVELSFNGVQGRFLQLKVLSRNPFNLAEFEVYGEG